MSVDVTLSGLVSIASLSLALGVLLLIIDCRLYLATEMGLYQQIFLLALPLNLRAYPQLQ